MGRVSRLLKHSWVRSWLGCSGSWKRIPINLCRCDNTLFRRGTNQESIECWAYLRSTTACANKRCSIGWSASSSRYSMMPALDIDEGDRRRTHCARSGKRSRVGRSGLWMQISETFSGLWTTGRSPPNSETAGRAVASAEDADRARPARLRISWLQDQARGEETLSAREPDP